MATKDLKQMDKTYWEGEAPDMEEMRLAFAQIQTLDADDIEAFVFTAKMRIHHDGTPRKSDDTLTPVVHGMCGNASDIESSIIALVQKFSEKMVEANK